MFNFVKAWRKRIETEAYDLGRIHGYTVGWYEGKTEGYKQGKEYAAHIAYKLGYEDGRSDKSYKRNP